MVTEQLLRVSRLAAMDGLRIAASTTAASLASLLLMAATPVTSAHAANGDCSQPVSMGEGPTASDCLAILRTAVGSLSCDPECICAPKGTLPVSASDALLCLRFAVGHTVELHCPCDVTTTTTVPPSTTTTTAPVSGVVGAISLQGRMNANQKIGLPAATAACEENFPGSHYCEYSEILASEGAKLTGLEDINDDTVTEFWAIDPNQSLARQCGQSLNQGAPPWTYNTAHIGVGGDFVELDSATGTLGTLEIGGGGLRNCFDSKWVGCCR